MSTWTVTAEPSPRGVWVLECADLGAVSQCQRLSQALREFPLEIRQQPRYNATTEAAIAEGDAIAESCLRVPSYASWSDFEASLDDDEKRSAGSGG